MTLREMVAEVLRSAHPSDCMSAATVAERVSDRLRGALWSPDTFALLEVCHLDGPGAEDRFTEAIIPILAELAESGRVERYYDGDAARPGGEVPLAFCWHWGGLKMAY